LAIAQFNQIRAILRGGKKLQLLLAWVNLRSFILDRIWPVENDIIFIPTPYMKEKFSAKHFGYAKI